MNWDFNTIGIFLNLMSALAVLITVIIMALQVREMRRATYAGTFKTVYDTLQEETLRDARGIVLRDLPRKHFETWTEEERKAAEKVCYTYDCVGIMIRNGMIPVKVVADSWGYSLRHSWRIVSPMVTAYRALRNSNEFWDDFEWVAGQAEKYHKSVSAGDHDSHTY